MSLVNACCVYILINLLFWMASKLNLYKVSGDNWPQHFNSQMYAIVCDYQSTCTVGYTSKLGHYIYLQGNLPN